MLGPRLAEKRLMAALLEKEAVNAIALMQLVREAEMLGIPTTELLLARDLTSDEELAQLYAEVSNLRFLELAGRRPTMRWVGALPENEARRKTCLVMGEVAGHVVAALSDPFDASTKAMLSRYVDRPLHFVVSPRRQLLNLIDSVYRPKSGETEGAAIALTEPSEEPIRIPRIDSSPTPAGPAPAAPAPPSRARHAAVAQRSAASEGPPIAERVSPERGGPAPMTRTIDEFDAIVELDNIVREAMERRASDIHIEPERDRLRVRFRVDGRMIESRRYPLEAAPLLVSRIKVLSNLDITERRRPQDGRLTRGATGREIDIRVATIPTARGERVALRLLTQDRTRATFEQLGMEGGMRARFEQLIARPYGIILITGPAGSGKTTTLYAALQRINTVDKHIITVEDPVEYQIAGVNQVAVDEEHGVSFSMALRSILRHNPDVIMVGEVRDAQTAHLALEASLTGHLVFTTLHTNTAVGAITRLLDMGLEPYLVAHAIVGVMAQRLVRKICDHCRREYDANELERETLGMARDAKGVKLYRGSGCARCLRTGYFDRLAIHELAEFDSGVAKLMMARASGDEIQQYVVSRGTVPIRADAMAKVRQGLTTLDEALRATAGMDTVTDE